MAVVWLLAVMNICIQDAFLELKKRFNTKTKMNSSAYIHSSDGAHGNRKWQMAF